MCYYGEPEMNHVTTTATGRPEAGGRQAGQRNYVMLGMAPLGFALNF